MVCLGASRQMASSGERKKVTIVHSLILGPQTFSDFFHIMKIWEEADWAINVLHIYFLEMCLV